MNCNCGAWWMRTLFRKVRLSCPAPGITPSRAQSARPSPCTWAAPSRHIPIFHCGRHIVLPSSDPSSPASHQQPTSAPHTPRTQRRRRPPWTASSARASSYSGAAFSLRTFSLRGKSAKTPLFPGTNPQRPACWESHFLKVKEHRRSAPQVDLRVRPQFVRRYAAVLASIEQQELNFQEFPGRSPAQEHVDVVAVVAHPDQLELQEFPGHAGVQR